MQEEREARKSISGRIQGVRPRGKKKQSAHQELKEGPYAENRSGVKRGDKGDRQWADCNVLLAILS